MLELSAFRRAAAFDDRPETRVFDVRMQPIAERIAETAAATPADPLLLSSHLEIPPLRSFRWRDVNWGLIGGVLFSLLLWCAFFISGVPALGSALRFVLNRSAA